MMERRRSVEHAGSITRLEDGVPPVPRRGVSMADFLGLFATLACGLFAGAAIYVSLVEHPARLSCRTGIAYSQWAPSYKRGTVMQASLAVMSGTVGIARW